MIAVAGAGAFGTALAVVQANAGQEVTLWGRDAEAMARTARSRQNPRLPGIRLPDGLTATSDLADLAHADALLVAVPAQETAAFLARHAASLPDAPLVLCAKGIGRERLRLQTEIAAETRPARGPRRPHRPRFRRRDRPRPAHRLHAGLRRRQPRAAPCRNASPAPACASTSPTMSSAPSSAGRSRTSSPSPAAWSRARASAPPPAPP